MKNRKLNITLFIIVVALIWAQSIIPPSTSTNESSWITSHLINPVLNFLGFESLSVYIVRKIAHVTEFAVLGLVTSTLFRKKWKNYAYAILICFIVAFIDESIQMFSGRAAAILDVWIDLSGAVAGSALGFILKRRK
ncbi:MAG: VanZ family protein [Sphaerochaetaceae bacterium]|nr:VanZ family protein [Sphaerochaetaceae bacterium]